MILAVSMLEKKILVSSFLPLLVCVVFFCLFVLGFWFWFFSEKNSYLGSL